MVRIPCQVLGIRPGREGTTIPNRSATLGGVDVSDCVKRLSQPGARVGVIGLGYVGLPLAQSIVAAGHRVLGFDIDPSKIEALARGRSYIHHLDIAGLLSPSRRLLRGDFGL